MVERNAPIELRRASIAAARPTASEAHAATTATAPPAAARVIESPTDAVGFLAQVINRAQVEANELSVRSADDAVGERRLYLGRERGKGGDRVVSTNPRIIGDQRQTVGFLEADVRPEIDDIAAIGDQGRIAAS